MIDNSPIMKLNSAEISGLNELCYSLKLFSIPCHVYPWQKDNCLSHSEPSFYIPSLNTVRRADYMEYNGDDSHSRWSWLITGVVCPELVSLSVDSIVIAGFWCTFAYDQVQFYFTLAAAYVFWSSIVLYYSRVQGIWSHWEGNYAFLSMWIASHFDLGK